jgi:acetoin utilization deacetylase AcuC-like enzyme
MKVIMHEAFHQAYTSDPAAAPGRIQAVVDAVQTEHVFVEAVPAPREAIAAVHTEAHIESVAHRGLYEIAALAAGGAIQAAEIGLDEPCFALVRPPGHHASAHRSWGFCYFNNMAVALEHLRRSGKIDLAYILDFDLHYGDGTVSILKNKGYAGIHNPRVKDREAYLENVAKYLSMTDADIIGVSAGFDNHLRDWGGVLYTEDYGAMGRLVREASERLGCGCFAVLEGGYNHSALAKSVRAFLRGLEGNSGTETPSRVFFK